MRFPSIGLLARGASRTLLRFPLVLLSALVAATAGIFSVNGGSERNALLKLLATAHLGIPLLYAIAVATERRIGAVGRRLAAGTVAIIALAGYYISLPAWMTPTATTRLVQLDVGLLLLTAFVPFVGTREHNGFWQYNKTLFLRFLTAVLYSGVLFVGLSIALLAVDQLFGVDIDDKVYARLWIVIAFVFNTWFFLGGIPVDLGALDRASDYPKGIKVFTQYILIPLVIVYLAILTTYLGKVIVTRVWPSGWIGYLVSSVAATGILALLLVHPVRDDAGNKWVRTYARWFYVFLMPSIVMVMLAIYQRIEQYGVTERRYFLAVLSVWLGALAVYHTVTQSRNIRVIPLSLCVVAFVTSFGPWGAYSVSARSQTRRLGAILIHSDILQDGKVHPAPGDVTSADRREINAIVRYLVETHGAASLSPWFEGGLADVDTLGDIATALHPGEVEERVRAIVARMGVDYMDRWSTADSEHFFFNVRNEASVTSIEGYDYIVHFHGTGDAVTLEHGGVSYSVEVADSAAVRLRAGAEVLIDVPLRELVEAIRRDGTRSQSADRMRIERHSGPVRLLLQVDQIGGTLQSGVLELNQFVAACYIDLE